MAMSTAAYDIFNIFLLVSTNIDAHKRRVDTDILNSSIIKVLLFCALNILYINSQNAQARLIGRISYQDDPYVLNLNVQRGTMPIGTIGILLCITFLGAMLSQITIIPLADRWGRKFMFEACLLIMFISSIFSVSTGHISKIRI